MSYKGVRYGNITDIDSFVTNHKQRKNPNHLNTKKTQFIIDSNNNNNNNKHE